MNEYTMFDYAGFTMLGLMIRERNKYFTIDKTPETFIESNIDTIAEHRRIVLDAVGCLSPVAEKWAVKTFIEITS